MVIMLVKVIMVINKVMVMMAIKVKNNVMAIMLVL